MSDKIDYEAIYSLLDGVSPIDGDCGRLCGSACCRTDGAEEEMGIYLLPGEEVMQDRSDDWLEWEEDDPQDYDFPPSWTEKVYFVKCKGPGKCRRARRPIQCRTFPLEPYLTKEGELRMSLSTMDLPYVCPLVSGMETLDKSFVNVTKKAWKMLLKDERIYDLVWKDSREWDEE